MKDQSGPDWNAYSKQLDAQEANLLSELEELVKRNELPPEEAKKLASLVLHVYEFGVEQSVEGGPAYWGHPSYIDHKLKKIIDGY